MSKLGKLWTDAVAYVALILGAGLSIAGNVADTYRGRGHATDVLDIVMAVAWPALVVLMVEIFVSPRWVGLSWPMQVLRWVGTLSIGGMAMRVSWVHLNDLMASRGQKADVAILGPLAIDALAIMATALILAGRRGHVATPAPAVATDTLVDKIRERDADTVANWNGHAPADTATVATDTMATDPMATDPMATDTMATLLTDTVAEWPRTPDTFFRPVATDTPTATATWVSEHDDIPDPMATRPLGELDAWTAGYEDALSVSGQELATEVEDWVAKGAPDTVVPGTPPRRQLASSVPEGAVEMIRTWDGASAELVVALAGHFNVSTRTARRWRGAVLGPQEGGE